MITKKANSLTHRAARTLILSAVVLLLSYSHASAAENSASDLWYSILMRSVRIGYVHILTKPARYEGRKVVQTSSHTVMRLDLMGNTVEQVTDTTSINETKGRPLQQEYRIYSGGSTYRLVADYGNKSVDCKINSGGVVSTKIVPIPAGANLVADSTSFNIGKSEAPGQKATVTYLDPLTVSFESASVVIGKKEKVSTGDRKSTELIKVTASTPIGKMVSWQTRSGKMVRAEMPLGFTMEIASRQTAMSLGATVPGDQVSVGVPNPVSEPYTDKGSSYSPPPDFALATAITVRTPIHDPRTLHEMTIQVTGVNASIQIPSDNRQQVTPIPNERGSYQISVNATAETPDRSLVLPITGHPELQSYMQDGTYLAIHNPAIEKQAAKLKGDDRNAYQVVERIEEWVHRTVRPNFTIGVPRSSVDILKRPVGVCRDYATLFAALARSAGIPTRLCAGIVYAEGRFFYHAWDECWLGHWIPVDPTLGGAFVDATHVKFAEGGATNMYQIAGIVGHIRVNVLSAD
ncbi:MAG: transglutaminase-like domain-containing protein [Armatimonadetes bacterium]|nr:transglutaminase-like domain-containing protein [Armatimonadota bacterium]